MTNLRPPIVLVANASRHGSTAEIAARLGHQLRELLPVSAWLVHVEDTDAIQTLEGYDAVVLGSAVYFGRWLKSARKLLDNTEVGPPNGLWLFSSGPVGEGPDDDVVAVKEGDLGARFGVTENKVFAGRISRASLSHLERIATTLLRVSDGDFRDWNAIDQWAEGIARDLMGTAGLQEAQTVQEES